MTNLSGSFSVRDKVKEVGAGVDRFFINNEFVEPDSDSVYQHVHPATGEEDYTLAAGQASDVDKAVRAARAAFDDGPWGKMHARERILKLRPLSDMIRKEAERFAILQSLDNVLPIGVGSSFRFSSTFSGDLFDYFLGWADKISGEAPPVYSEHANSQLFSIKEPVGVVGAITPFNGPVMQFAQKLAPALAAGCTVVLKPSEYASNVTMHYARIFQELDLPPGVFNVVTGSGTTAAEMVKHPMVDKIAFTGRGAVGRDILINAAATMKRVQLELGGKSPSIVFDDVEDIEAVGRYCMGAVSMGLSGQVCSTQTRAIVHRKVYDRFVAAAQSQIADVKYGDPFDPTVTSSPLVTRSSVTRVTELIARAIEDGAELVAGGKAVVGLGNGTWVQPTLLAKGDNEAESAQEEIFGPALGVIPFDTEEEAIRLANRSNFGLSAGVYTRDPSRAIRVARALRTGTIAINSLFVSPPTVPFGGYKLSGLGKEGGRMGFDGYLETKTIGIPL